MAKKYASWRIANGGNADVDVTFGDLSDGTEPFIKITQGSDNIWLDREMSELVRDALAEMLANQESA